MNIGLWQIHRLFWLLTAEWNYYHFKKLTNYKEVFNKTTLYEVFNNDKLSVRESLLFAFRAYYYWLYGRLFWFRKSTEAAKHWWAETVQGRILGSSVIRWFSFRRGWGEISRLIVVCNTVLLNNRWLGIQNAYSNLQLQQWLYGQNVYRIYRWMIIRSYHLKIFHCALILFFFNTMTLSNTS